jgi:cob(I)alamin adenosyltransferase
MSITTKSGDKGMTSLQSGERVWKDDLRVEAYGTLDELDALLGDARLSISTQEIRDILESIQKTLYRLMGQLACTTADYPYPLVEQDVEQVSALIAYLEEKTPLKGFVLPGSIPSSAKLDICRTVSRRAERCIVRLSRDVPLSPEILQYVNRLSDLFFIMARTLEAEAGALRYLPNHSAQ